MLIAMIVMILAVSMTTEIFTEQAVSAWKKDLIGVIREQSIVRKLYPQNEGVTPADGNYIYYKIKEQSNIQYGFELQRRQFSVYATEKVSTPIPLHQGDMTFTRHEAKRAAKDVLKLDRRVLEMIEDIVQQEESKGIYGDDDTGTVLHDTTNVSTAASPELDMGTFKEGMEDFHGQVSQLRNLLKNKFQGCKLKIVWSPNVDDRAKAIASTTSEEITLYDYISDWLVKFNGGGTRQDHVFASGFLESATGAGANASALIASDARNMELVSSELEVIQGRDNLQNLDIEVTMRSKPVFYRDNKSVIFGTGVVLTA